MKRKKTAPKATTLGEITTIRVLTAETLKHVDGGGGGVIGEGGAGTGIKCRLP